MIKTFYHFVLAYSLVISAQAYGASDAYSQPFAGLTVEEKQSFYLGQSLFERFWVPSPSSTTASDGLGPLFNARSCHSCHIRNGRGHAPTANQLGSEVPSFFIRLGDRAASNSSTIIGDLVYGRQFQPLSSTNVAPEGDYKIIWRSSIVILNDGTEVSLRRPDISWQSLRYGDFNHNTGFSPRVSPPLVGMGLLDAVPDSVILSYADPDDIDQDGISGKPNWLERHGEKHLGRFGHKAHVPNLNEQNQSAFNGDLGLSTPLFPNPSGDCSAMQSKCRMAPDGNSPHLDNLEVGHKQMQLLNSYVALSRPPAMRHLNESWFLDGKKIFDSLRCASCHRPKLTTGRSSFSALNHRDFYPFTDMLLHDMGPALQSGFPVLNASPQEWRTAPLWGIGLSDAVSGRNGFLHDGRARTIEEAILWHGGEAQASQQAYRTLNAQQRAVFIRFLESL
ncbi:hypothetical protein DN730_01070 [Marinomonas piezotolerans]|uniref:Cytochrome c domain-containing protein n=1 Tax=Marinomonas piezotolerans TaxID=2213058 RepID=A0A370UD18_9GAMM|nr:di-heme oxidoredictase family protein [Marinomonas piezotolerans]RDL45674.1 hypothetical protein DN730_01070 [Marinomonas piezotolerans]